MNLLHSQSPILIQRRVNPRLWLALFLGLCAPLPFSLGLRAAQFDAAPFGMPLAEGQGLRWEDPREIHQVVVTFAEPPPPDLRLQYWGSRWPEQHLPKNRAPGGGDVGWMELGNWYNGGWRDADTELGTNRTTATFTFHRVNAKEFTKVKDYPAAFRYTLKLRLSSTHPLPKIQRLQTFTDSTVEPRSLRLAWERAPARPLQLEAFNGTVTQIQKTSSLSSLVTVDATANPDPNTFDRTLLSVINGKDRFTVRVDDLEEGALFLPEFGVAVLPASDPRTYAAVAAEQRRSGEKTLYQRVGELPEQTWSAAWAGMPPKKSHIYFPLGLDGGRERFLLEPDGSVRFRSNDHFLRDRPGRDTPRLSLEPDAVRFRFGPPMKLLSRNIQEESLPICHTRWGKNGLIISQTALVTELNGTDPQGPPPAPDAFAVFLARFVFTNASTSTQTAMLHLSETCSEVSKSLRLDPQGFVWQGDNLRGQVLADAPPNTNADVPRWSWTLKPGERKVVVVKLPYVVLSGPDERQALARLDFHRERQAVARYWRERLDQSAQLVTPEPVLNQFYRAHAGHLLINCEGEPGSARRFARVGSFAYGAYGNESCMMVVDLDRRGYHQEAQDCLDAWLHYQGTVGLPGDFDSQAGVLYGAGGYEAGGYNQHHGWILWCLAEHYRFTRDRDWLRQAAPGILAAADWIIGQTRRTAERQPLEQGLLPAGSLEDIGDWWTWLSTSCYTWRGLDSAAWALEQIHHPDAPRIRSAADAFHTHLLASFRAAAQRSPVVRLRDGTAVPQFPSYVQRRGRSFGWICETLEGALHLLITGALDPHSPEAEWLLKDYEDNLYLSNQYGYTLDNFDKYWFGRGGMSMQACLLLDVEPYLYRDDVKQALRALFNALAASHFPDVHMNTEHALPHLGDWRGDHYKTSDEANACGWLRQLFVREQGDELLLGQAIPRTWLNPGQQCGLERAATYFGQTSVLFTGSTNQIIAELDGPRRNPPRQIRIRFRTPGQHPLQSVSVDGKPWKKYTADWVQLPGDIGSATVVVKY